MRALIALVLTAALAETESAFDVPGLERVLAERLSQLREFPDPLFPVEIEDETISALKSLGRLNGEGAAERAREALALTSFSRLAWEARKILVKEGDVDAIRAALSHYFEDEERWGAVLAESDDPRLADFRREGAPEPSVTRRRFLSTLEWNLSRARSRQAVRALVRWAEASTDTESPRRVLAAMEEGTAYDVRIERFLAGNSEAESPEGAGERPRRAVEDRGRTLAAIVLSETAGQEEKRVALADLRDLWEEALSIPAPGLAEAMISLAGERALGEFIAETVDVDALAAIPLREARARLESIGSAEAIARLMKRSDRTLSLPFLETTRRAPDRAAARASELALVSLGAPGSSAFLRRELATRANLEDLLAPISIGPVDAALAFDVLRGPGAKAPPAPEAFAALIYYLERYPGAFLSWLSRPSEDGERLRERAYFVLSFSGEPRALPLLVDVAVGGVETSAASRQAAFYALFDAELGAFAARLHRLAGDPERETRFRAAAALVPTGEVWPLRLLLAEVDTRSDSERRIARRAIRRLPPARARELLGDMVSEHTAGSFGVVLLQELGGEAKAQELWTIVRDGALAGDETALLAASRIETAEAVQSVTRFLTAHGSAW